MNVVLRSFGETQQQGSQDTSKSSRELPMEPRAQKWNWVWVSTVSALTSRKTNIAKSVRGPKSQEPRAEDALAESYLVQKIVVTWLQQSTYFSVKKVTLGTIIDMPWLYKIWQRCGYSPTREKLKLPRRPRRTYWSSWSQRGNPKSFTLTIPWNLASRARDYPGIIVRQHHTDRKRMGLLREQCAEWKKEHLQYCYNRVWNATAICETFKISFLMGAVKKPIQRASKTVWCNGGVLFLGCVLYAGWIWKGDICDRRHWRIGGGGRMRTPRLESRCKRKCQRRWRGENSYSQSQMEQSKSLAEIVWETSTLIRDRPDRGEEQEVLRGESDGLSSPNPLRDDSTRDDTEAKNDFLVHSGRFSYCHHLEPRVKLHVLREETFPIPMKYIDVTRTTHTSLDVLLEKPIDDHWNVDGERELSDAWTGFTRFDLQKGKAIWRMYIVREEASRGNKHFSSWRCVARYAEIYVRCSKEESKTKIGYRKTKAR